MQCCVLKSAATKYNIQVQCSQGGIFFSLSMSLSMSLSLCMPSPLSLALSLSLCIAVLSTYAGHTHFLGEIEKMRLSYRQTGVDGRVNFQDSYGKRQAG